MPQFICTECKKEIHCYHEIVKGRTHRQFAGEIETNCQGTWKQVRGIPHTHGCLKCDAEDDCWQEECEENYGILQCFECEENAQKSPNPVQITLFVL